MLDLVWSNDAHLISNVAVEDWPTFTDHKVVIAHTTFQLGRQEEVREDMHLLESGKRFKQLDFNKAEWSQIKSELGGIDWSPMQDLESSSSLSWFFEQILPILERLVPQRKVKSKRKNRPMMDRRCSLLWKRLAKCKVKVKTASSLHQLTKLLQEKSNLEQQLGQDYDAVNKMEEDEAVLKIKDNPKAFFSFAKSRQQTRAKIGPFLDPISGKPNPCPDFAASELSRQYSSVFVTPRQAWKIDDAKDFFKDSDDQVTSLSDIIFSEDDIVKACKELKSSSAAGADGVPAALLKNCCQELKHPLFLFWRSSMDTGCIPPDLLLVLVSPVHKGGSRGVAKNYRPVALTSHIVKVFERVVRRSLVSYLESHGFLPDGQHGFRSMRSTLTQLLSYWDAMLTKLEEGGGADAIYLDFSKAFDKVEHGVLLHKLREFGVTGKVGIWIAAFLDSALRQQAVVVDGRVSELSHVISGVPQGTVLGPVLFLVHIACIANSLSSGTQASSFADDTRVMRGIKSISDCEVLQADLLKIYNWADEVNMHFNADKFECLRFFANQGDAPTHQYLAPDSAPIQVKLHLRDLGVEISSDLTFKVHITKMVTAASRLAGWGLRTFRRRSVTIMVTLWKSIIQPKLDYCSQLWTPDDQDSINTIESVQEHFLSKVAGTEKFNHWERLKFLHLYSQERRRERYVMIFLWKISEGRVKGYEVDFSNSDRRGRMALPKPYVRTAPAAVRRARESSLAVKGCKLFNLLPADIRNMSGCSIDTFKHSVDEFLATIPDQPTVPGLLRAASSNSLIDQLAMQVGTTSYF